MKSGIATISLGSNKIHSSLFEKIRSIPDKPKIPLGNYLLDLISESDGKESSIYLKGIERFIKEIWTEMINGNWKKLQTKKMIPKELGIHWASIYAYKNGKKAISIQMMYKLLLLWKTYCRKKNEDVKKVWNKIYESDFTYSVHKGLQPTKLPRYLTPKLSYLIGWICGDGHMADYGNHYLVRMSEKSLHELYLLKSLIKFLFDINPPIFQIYEGGHALQFGNKPIFRFLTQILKIKVGEIPEIINKLDKVNKGYFLAGIFDSEGYVCKSRYRITISQANSEFLKKVIILANDLGIEFRGPVTHRTDLGTWYSIRIDRKDEILKFNNLIGTYHIDKSRRLKEKILQIYEDRYC